MKNIVFCVAVTVICGVRVQVRGWDNLFPDIAAHAVSCVASQCNQTCLNLRSNGGFCSSGGSDCWCWRSNTGQRSEDDDVVYQTAKEIQRLQNVTDDQTKCNDGFCHFGCMRNLYDGGLCKTWSECLCYKVDKTRDESTCDNLLPVRFTRYDQICTAAGNILSGQATDSNAINSCTSDCSGHRWDGGYMENGQCECWKIDSHSHITFESRTNVLNQ